MTGSEWEPVIDSASGHQYYHNRRTSATTWTLPPEVAAASTDQDVHGEMAETSWKDAKNTAAGSIQLGMAQMLTEAKLEATSLASNARGHAKLGCFKQSCSTWSATDAHGYNAILLVGSPKLSQDQTCLT